MCFLNVILDTNYCIFYIYTFAFAFCTAFVFYTVSGLISPQQIQSAVIFGIECVYVFSRRDFCEMPPAHVLSLVLLALLSLVWNSH